MIEFLPRLRRFAYALTRNMDLADDLVQETCARALAHADKWTSGTRLDSWLYRIAQNIWIDQGRLQRGRGETAEMDLAANVAGFDGRTVTESRLTLDFIDKCMDRLPKDQQTLIALVCVDGLSYKEAAEVLQLPIGTVMSRLARARQALSGFMTEEPISDVPSNAHATRISRHGIRS
jgi:RNA polymerase sigma-70 factor (ECF subfamily)